MAQTWPLIGEKWQGNKQACMLRVSELTQFFQLRKCRLLNSNQRAQM
jgi:hypothetical protein